MEEDKYTKLYTDPAESIQTVHSSAPTINLMGIGLTATTFLLLFIIFFIVFGFAFTEANYHNDLTFVYVNDIHIDPLYHQNGDPATYCRTENPNKTDVKYRWGIYGCDAPIETYESMLKFMPSVVKKPDFLLFGGDALGHRLGYDMSKVASTVADYMKMYSDVFPSAPLFITLGNNEFVPNYGNFQNDPDAFQKLADSLSQWISKDQVDSFKKGGYVYHDFPKQKLRMLFLNTVMYTTNRNLIGDSDPWDQFSWIEEKCQEAQDKGLKIGVALHIPSGISATDMILGWQEPYTNRYNQIMEKYDIQFHIAGHSHFDLFMPVFKDGEAPQRFQLSAPSISPAHGNNPAFRVLKVRNGKLVEYFQYYAEIMNNPKELKWELEYKFTASFRVPDISVKSLRNATSWASNTGEGMWKYLEHIMARAGHTNSFYHCILHCVNQEQISQCMHDIQPLSLVPRGERILFRNHTHLFNDF